MLVVCRVPSCLVRSNASPNRYIDRLTVCIIPRKLSYQGGRLGVESTSPWRRLKYEATQRRRHRSVSESAIHNRRVVSRGRRQRCWSVRRPCPRLPRSVQALGRLIRVGLVRQRTSQLQLARPRTHRVGAGCESWSVRCRCFICWWSMKTMPYAAPVRRSRARWALPS